MKIYLTKDFKKAYKKRIELNENLVNRFEQRYDLFENDPSDPTLKDHALIGTHNQVYGE